MDTGIESSRNLSQLGKASDTRDTLARAKRAVQAAGLEDWLVVDVDAHHFENQSWAQIVELIPNDIVRHVAESFTRNGVKHPGIMQSSAWPAIRVSVAGSVTIRGWRKSPRPRMVCIGTSC